MIVYFGYGTLVIAFVASIFGVVAAIYGRLNQSAKWLTSARRSVIVVFPLLSLSVLSLILLLLNEHFEVLYVYNVVSSSMPDYLKITALWGGQPGSLLFWVWTLSAFTFAVMLRKWSRDRELLPWIIIISMVTIVFFLSMVMFVENPFRRIWEVPGVGDLIAMFPPAGAILLFPANGTGLNPLLRHPGMIIHPPALYLGFVSFVIPFAFAMAALIEKRTDDRWVKISRPWTLIAWLFLSLGLILGSRWAYDVLGWGGYWGWDPVEIAAFMPWLTGTAFLHSIMVQEKNQGFKRWNVILISLTFLLVIYGTFLTRSGVFSSVHAFAQSAVGPMFFIFLGLIFVFALVMLFLRWNDLRSEESRPKEFSREWFFWLNNILFMGVLLVCFWGVFFPLVSELITGQQVTVGPPYYERAVGPLLSVLMLVMGLVPLSTWRHVDLKKMLRLAAPPFIVSILAVIGALISGVVSLMALLGIWVIVFSLGLTLYEYGREAWMRSRNRKESILKSIWTITGKNRRRYGGYIIHIGVLLMALGIVGIELLQADTQGAITTEDSIQLRGYEISYKGLDVFDSSDGRSIARAVVSISRNGKEIAEVFPRRDFYYDSQQIVTIPGVYSRLREEIYITLVGWESISMEKATFKVYHNPLINWLWLGSVVLSIGLIVAVLPNRKSEREDSQS